jgi:predicted nuclease of predicted toxin-antitoxin system
MKLLLDESLPRQLVEHFPDQFEISTVQRMGWAGSKNGDLLRLAAGYGFDALITADQGIEHQQNLERLPIPVVVMIAHRTRVQELHLLIDRVVNLVAGDLQRRVYHVIE